MNASMYLYVYATMNVECVCISNRFNLNNSDEIIY